MAYNTKEIIKDIEGNPISQYYNPITDSYEPVEGSSGGNKVVLYNADGTENNSLSLIPILDKLAQLTGTIIDEETRKSNELSRIAFYELLQQKLADGDLIGAKGDTGLGLEFNWSGTQLGVRVEGDLDYIYVDLKGEKGDKGDTGNIDNLNSTHIIDALGYTPADDIKIGPLASLATLIKTNIVNAINSLKGEVDAHKADLATQLDLGHVRLPGNYASLPTKNGWSVSDGTTGYYKDDFGFVHVLGKIAGGLTTSGTVIMTLPLGYRPANYTFNNSLSFSSASSVMAVGIMIDGNGDVSIFSDALAVIYLDFTFRI